MRGREGGKRELPKKKEGVGKGGRDQRGEE
jgi:hypothetical protein